MESTRLKKISRLLQRELSDIFQREARTLFHGKMITVTVVRVSPDLGIAKVYLSFFPLKEDDDPIAIVNEHAWNIKSELSSRVKHQLRKLPELHYYLDDSLDYIDNINRLLKS